MIRATTLALVLVLVAPALAKDTVELETGRVLEGDIVRNEKQWIGIDTGDGIVWVRRAEIKAISRGDDPQPSPIPEKTDESADEGVRRQADGERTERPVRQPTVRRPTGTAAKSTVPAKDERLSAEAEHVRSSLSSEEPETRVKAADWIAETWPRWRSEVLHALTKSEDEVTRLEAVRVLDRDNVSDDEQLIDIALEDKSAKVRVAALRIARHRKFTGVETRAVELMRSDPTWRVRQEAIRTLEDIGGGMCLPHVMAAWSAETDDGRKRRYRRVMKVLLGDDFGDDTAGWYRAADELFMGDREIRKGKKKTKGDK